MGDRIYQLTPVLHRITVLTDFPSGSDFLFRRPSLDFVGGATAFAYGAAVAMARVYDYTAMRP